MDKIHLTWKDVHILAERVAHQIVAYEMMAQRTPLIYGPPRGGIQAAQLVRAALLESGVKADLAETPEDCNCFVDDIIDTGKTRSRYKSPHSCKPFHALVDQEAARNRGEETKWYIFPWERMTNEDGPEENIRRILEYIGENPDREGLVNTPARVIRSYEKLYGGYKQSAEGVLKTVFTDGACDEMVVLRDLEFYSNCEHHMQPFFGRAHIGYLPDKRVVGVSKLARLLEVFARRLQIQERLGEQITQALMEHLKPLGCGCILEAQHFCMTARGVEKQNSIMVTSSLKGVFLEKPEARSEFLRMVGK